MRPPFAQPGAEPPHHAVLNVHTEEQSLPSAVIQAKQQSLLDSRDRADSQGRAPNKIYPDL